MDISDLIENKEPLSDLGWLNPVGDANIPTQNNYADSVPELSEQWDYSGTRRIEAFNEYATSQVGSKSNFEIKQASSDLVKKAKIAAMKGDDIDAKLASCFTSDFLSENADTISGIKAIAPILQNVCIDLSVFKDEFEARKVLGVPGSRVKFVYGKPDNGISVSSSGRSVVLQLPVFDTLEDGISCNLPYFSELSKNVLGDLPAVTDVPSAADFYQKLASAEKQPTFMGASLSAHQPESRHLSPEFLSVQPDYGVEKIDKTAVSEVQRAMFKGVPNSDLKKQITARFTKETIAPVANHIFKVLGLPGVIGNVALDVSAYNTAQEAEKDISKFCPKILLCLDPECGFAEGIAVKRGLQIIDKANLTSDMVLDAMNLSPEVSERCKSFVASGDPVDVAISKGTKLSARVSEPEASDSAVRISVNAELEDAKKYASMGSLPSIVKEAFLAGHAYPKVEAKVVDVIEGENLNVEPSEVLMSALREIKAEPGMVPDGVLVGAPEEVVALFSVAAEDIDYSAMPETIESVTGMDFEDKDNALDSQF